LFTLAQREKEEADERQDPSGGQSAAAAMLTLVELGVFAQSTIQQGDRNDPTDGVLPTGLWVAIGISIAVFSAGVIVLQIALWYPNSCLAIFLISMRIPSVSRSIEERRAQISNRSNPVEGIPLTSLRPQRPVATGPIAVGQPIPASQHVVATAVAVPVI
jgi:hypothetical protein